MNGRYRLCVVLVCQLHRSAHMQTMLAILAGLGGAFCIISIILCELVHVPAKLPYDLYTVSELVW